MRQWPAENDIVPDVLREPVQSETQALPFTLKHKGKQYSITPKFNYELWGLVVSCHESADPFDYYHEQWGDDLNVKDLCVVWGQNVKSGVFRKMQFSSGSWTCYPKCSGSDWPQIMNKFRYDQLSNNHILAESSSIFDRLRRIRRGDQIYLKGYLAEYSHSGGKFHRGTSVTRTDTGNGACETIFIKDLKILRESHPVWRRLNVLVFFLLLMSLALLFAGFVSRYTRKPKDSDDPA